MSESNLKVIPFPVFPKQAKKLVKNKKAESSIVGSLLLIAVAVAASIVSYSWVMSMVNSQSTQAQTQVRVESIQWKNNTSTNKLDAAILTIRNTGSVEVWLDSVSISNNQGTVGAALLLKMVISPGKIATYTFEAGIDGVPTSWAWLTSKTYVVRATVATGYYYEFTSTSPSTLPVAS